MAITGVRIGTRGSPLALWQARATQTAIAAALDLETAAIEIVVIRTTGDQVRDRPLAEIGGKGLFTKEIEERLLDGSIDIAVHSAKDVPTFLPDGLAIAGFLPRADLRDALISPSHRTLDALPHGAVVGTASIRRAALIRNLRPDLKTVFFRGNVETRLRKVAEGEVDATLLAYAGLVRLGLEAHATEVFDPDVFLSAVGQGAIALQIRADDADMREVVAAIDHAETTTALSAERAMLAVLDGSCRTPIAGRALVYGDRISLRGIVVDPDGSRVWEARREGGANDAAEVGIAAGEELLGQVPPGVLVHGGEI